MMNLHNDQSLNLRDCVGSGASAVEIAKKRENPVILDSGRPLVPSVEFLSFPTPISRLVGEYLPSDERSHVATAFAGVQPISLCLSQDVGSKLASCWPIGFLPPDHQWKPSDAKIDKDYLIQDYQGCLQLLEQRNSNYCHTVITVLVVKLSRTSEDLPMALNDLRNTIEALKLHLSSVKHVVFSMEEYAFCCFTLNDAIGKVDKIRQSIDHSKALFEIIDDLDRCWNENHTLTVHHLLAFYFNSEAKRASEEYLAKFVIPVHRNLNRELFCDDASTMLSTKIMWVCLLSSSLDVDWAHQYTSRPCHAIHIDMCVMERDELMDLSNNGPGTIYFKDTIERIVIDSALLGRIVRLPEPRMSLTHASPRSALIELSLTGEWNTFDLSQLNNGHFPHLTHLSMMGGEITGHLDSRSVPSLKNLILFVKNLDKRNPKMNSLICERTQSLIHAGRPWQLVASSDQFGGWSLASYDKAIPNPQEDEKKGSSLFLPFIKELLLVVHSQQCAFQCQSRLNEELSLEAMAKDQKNGLLGWAPDRVEKITAFWAFFKGTQLHFNEEIPGKTRVLSSLECHGFTVFLEGAVLPHLKSLEVNYGDVNLSGTFPQLQKLSLRNLQLISKWQVNAPLLASLDCDNLIDGGNLSLRPEKLPRLSYLRIEPCPGFPVQSPEILADEDNLGLSRVNHVVFGKGMTQSPYFNQCQVHNVSHLELAVDPLEMPAGWENTKWQCETLTLHIYVNHPLFGPKRNLNFVKVRLLLSKVKTLTLTEKDCWPSLDSAMPELIDLTVPSTRSLGPNVKCPKLRCIRFTWKFLESHKVECLDPTMFEAIGAQPKLVYFGDNSDAKRVSWDVAQSATSI